jgi:hypothetical protein
VDATSGPGDHFYVFFLFIQQGNTYEVHIRSTPFWWTWT